MTDYTICCVFLNKKTIYIEKTGFLSRKSLHPDVRQAASNIVPGTRSAVPNDWTSNHSPWHTQTMASRAGKTPYQTYWTSNNPSARSSGESIDQNPGHDSGGFLSWRDISPKSADLLASREYFDKNRRNASNHDGYGLIVKNTGRMSITPIYSDGVFVVTSPAEILP